MKNLIFNQTGIFHLKRMAFRAQAKYQQRFALSDEAGIIALIRFAESVRDIEMKRNFMLFYINSPDEVKAYLLKTYNIASPVERFNIGKINSA
ncbi:MAG: hypothetical protein H7A00_02840 [Hahellaceae bacterium]|nr:hypothetical protein [Hahellaceae bacterium]